MLRITLKILRLLKYSEKQKANNRRKYLRKGLEWKSICKFIYSAALKWVKSPFGYNRVV